MPAGPNLTFEDLVDVLAAINNPGEIALLAPVHNTAGPSGTALVLFGTEGQPQPLLLSRETVPGIGKLQMTSSDPALTDAGAVAFLARRPGEKQDSAYLWEQGTITPLLTVGTEVPGVGSVTSVSHVLMNNQNRSVLVAAGIGSSSRQGLYRVEARQVTPLAVPGQPLPGGGKLANLQNVLVESTGIRSFAVSAATAAGEYVFVATLEDGTTSAYRLTGDGTVSLNVKGGMMSNLGAITRVEASPGALNSQGEVALVLRVNNGPETLVLLTLRTP